MASQESTPNSPNSTNSPNSPKSPNSPPITSPNSAGQVSDSPSTDPVPGPALPSRSAVKDYFNLLEPVQFTPIKLQESTNYLLEYNLHKLEQNFQKKTDSERAQINDGVSNVRSLFSHLKTAISINDTTKNISWDDWENLVNNNLSIPEIVTLVSTGIPDEIRSVIWQVISRSANLKLNDYYLMNKQNPSIHESQIKKDITRNSFYNSIQKYDRIGDIFNNLKIYSQFDDKIGYNQSFIFLLSPIILKMPELESFNLFVTLMNDYNLRQLYDDEMTGLQLMLYKFDRLMEIYSPKLFNHLIKQGIKSNLFASQWFLTLFSYKFPIDIVLLIYDFIIFEGIDFLLKLALKLMTLNEPILLNLRFDSLLQYLNSNVLDVFVNQNFKPGEVYYDTKLIFSDLVNLNPNFLGKLEVEFNKLDELNRQKVDDINKLNLSNGKLRNEIKYLQLELFNLNKDHLDVVQNLINLKVRLPEIANQNIELQEQIDQLNETLNDMKDIDESDVPHNIEHEIEKLLVENKQETEKNISLEDQLNELQKQEEELDVKLSSYKKNWFWSR